MFLGRHLGYLLQEWQLLQVYNIDWLQRLRMWDLHCMKMEGKKVLVCHARTFWESKQNRSIFPTDFWALQLSQTRPIFSEKIRHFLTSFHVISFVCLLFRQMIIKWLSNCKHPLFLHCIISGYPRIPVIFHFFSENHWNPSRTRRKVRKAQAASTPVKRICQPRPLGRHWRGESEMEHFPWNLGTALWMGMKLLKCRYNADILIYFDIFCRYIIIRDILGI